MPSAFSLLLCLFVGSDVIETRFEQVYPLPRVKDIAERSPGQKRAVLLVPGLLFHPISNVKVHQAEIHDWQKSGSNLVSALSRRADVFAFAYSQNVPLESICRHPALANSVQRLRVLGYDEIIVIGHSAGGIITRMFVEDNPHSGVTRVIQVCAPNTGSYAAKTDIRAKDQEAFLRSLTKEVRQKSCQMRGESRIPPNVEFLCVIVSTGNLGDGLVSIASQWPDDLQTQGIPAVRLSSNHFSVLRAQKTAERVADLAVQGQPRWTAAEVAARRKLILNGKSVE